MNHDVQLLVFQLEKHSYGVRLARVERVIHAVEFTPLPGSPDVVWGVINHHGQVIPLLNLRKRFGFEDRPIGVHDQFVIVSATHRVVALVVDRIVGIETRKASDLIESEKIVDQKALDRSGQIEGAIQIGDDLILIHDLDRALDSGESKRLDEALAKQEPDAK